MKSLEKTVKSSLLPNDKARKRKTPNCNFPPDILVFSMLNALKSPNHKKKSVCVIEILETVVMKRFMASRPD